jgi:hypothetical protein
VQQGAEDEEAGEEGEEKEEAKEKAKEKGVAVEAKSNVVQAKYEGADKIKDKSSDKSKGPAAPPMQDFKVEVAVRFKPGERISPACCHPSTTLAAPL